jgi:hypothetical protein
MLPHIHVHRGRHEDRRRGGQVEGGQEVVGDAVRELGQNVGRGRSDDQRVGPLRLADVFDGRVISAAGGSGIVPQAGNDLVAGERGKRERLHELAGRLGHDHMNFDGLPLQRAD